MQTFLVFCFFISYGRSFCVHLAHKNCSVGQKNRFCVTTIGPRKFFFFCATIIRYGKFARDFMVICLFCCCQRTDCNALAIIVVCINGVYDTEMGDDE